MSAVRRGTGRAIGSSAIGVAGLTLCLGFTPVQAAPGNEKAEIRKTMVDWEWESNRYLGHWKATLAWPELARCWQRYGGDATEVAATPPRGQAQRAIPVKVFPRHADFDRKRTIARRSGPYEEQQAALARLQSGGAPLAERVLDAIHGYFLDHDYHALVEEASGSGGEANLERLERRAAIGETLELESVHVHNKWRDGLSYVGLIFSTGWDDGHGLGVLLHGDRVVQVGGADTAFNPSQWADGELKEPREPWLR